MPVAASGHPPSKSADWILWLCFFGSGVTALIYEVLWTRMITNIIGGAPFAVARSVPALRARLRHAARHPESLRARRNDLDRRVARP